MKAGDNIPLPDLAVADYDCVRKGKSLKVRISNLGAASSSKTSVQLYDADNKIIADAPLPVIEAPADFVEKSLWVEFKKVPAGYLRIVVDPGSGMKELFKGNNETIIQ